jgi:hypothetical protein
MAITRRNFLVGVGAGLILPSVADRILSFVEETGHALLEPVGQADTLFHAIENGDGLILLDASVQYTTEPPPGPVTWREFFTAWGGQTVDEANENGWDVDPDGFADEWNLQTLWDRVTGAPAMAHNRLKQYEDQLGPNAVGGDSDLGYLIYNEGGHPGSDELWAEASSEIGLSALQHRLNNLNTGIRIEVSAW